MFNNLDLLKQCLNALNEVPNTRIDVGEHKNTYSLAACLSKEICKYEQAGEVPVYKARHVAELYVLDPDSHSLVEVSIYKDIASGGMFGIDSSYLLTLSDDDTVIEPFNGNDVLLLDGPFGSNEKRH